MKTLGRTFTLVALVFCLMGCRTQRAGESRKAERIFNEYDFNLLPSATLSITVTFNSDYTNAVSFWDKSAYPLETRFSQWPGTGNNDHVNLPTFHYTNSRSYAIPFALNAGYKNAKPPNDDQAIWNFANGVVQSYSPNEIVIGYPNALISGADPSNTRVTITITAGTLPDPRVP
jgi:hypothetical protein